MKEAIAHPITIPESTSDFYPQYPYNPLNPAKMSPSPPHLLLDPPYVTMKAFFPFVITSITPF